MPSVKWFKCSVGHFFTAVYSVGEIVEIGSDDSPDDLIRNALYVIPQPMQYSGTLKTVEANGFYFSGETVPADALLQLELRIYQRECDGTYASARNQTVSFALDNISDPYGLVIREEMNILVIEGDLLSFIVFTECSSDNRCPIQPVIVPNTTCTARPEVWYNSNGDINNLITRTDVFLNVRVSIGKCSIYCIWEDKL